MAQETLIYIVWDLFTLEGPCGDIWGKVHEGTAQMEMLDGLSATKHGRAPWQSVELLNYQFLQPYYNNPKLFEMQQTHQTEQCFLHRMVLVAW